MAWQEAHKLVINIYMTTKQFPQAEIFGLTSQIRRAAVSITSNIAESFGRYKVNEKLQFYYYARGSLLEIKNQLIIARDLEYLSIVDFQKLSLLTESAHKLLNGLIRASKGILH